MKIEERIEDSFVEKPNWSAVWSVALCVAGLIIAEFLPASLLTPMASELLVSEGTVGMAISVTAAVAMISSLFIGVSTAKLDRRWVLMGFSLLLVFSNLIVGYAPNFTILIIGRVLLGIGIGGCWSMMAATALRLVPKAHVPKALSIIFSSVSVATVLAAPLGSFLGMHIGWRNVFLLASLVGVISFVWQFTSLPVMPTQGVTKLREVFRILKRGEIRQGMLSTFFIFMSYAIFFSYLRPFLENVTHVTDYTLTWVLLCFGVANFLGASLSRYALEWDLHKTLLLAALFMGVCVVGLMYWGAILPPTVVLVSFWGTFFGIVQVGWTHWLTRTIPEQAESAGGLQTGLIQLAITLGALGGGLVIDALGPRSVFMLSIVCAAIAVGIGVYAFRNHLKFK